MASGFGATLNCFTRPPALPDALDKAQKLSHQSAEAHRESAGYHSTPTRHVLHMTNPCDFLQKSHRGHGRSSLLQKMVDLDADQRNRIRVRGSIGWKGTSNL